MGTGDPVDHVPMPPSIPSSLTCWQALFSQGRPMWFLGSRLCVLAPGGGAGDQGRARLSLGCSGWLRGGHMTGVVAIRGMLRILPETKIPWELARL